MASRLMLLDTASLYFRAFFGVPDTVRAPDGTPVNAVRGLLDFLARLVSKQHPARLVACLDADWRPQFRVDALASYKAHRVGGGVDGEDTPADLDRQVPIILDVLDALGICALGVPGFEADDVIGTLAHREAADVDIVTGDRDLFQLVNDERSVRVLYTARGVGNLSLVDDAEVVERYGVHAAQYADFATLRGDPSDGLPGVPGIGDKTAAALLRTYADLAGVQAAASDLRSLMPHAQRKRIMAATDYLAVAPAVVRVRLDVPVPTRFSDALPRVPRDADALADLDARFDLGSSLRRAQDALAES